MQDKSCRESSSLPVYQSASREKYKIKTVSSQEKRKYKERCEIRKMQNQRIVIADSYSAGNKYK